VGIAPPQRRYSPPPAEVCQFYTVPLRLPQPGNELRITQKTYRDHLVDFTVTQSIRSEGQWITVAQVLQEDGAFWLRQYARASGSDVQEDLELQVIPADGAWEVIGRTFDRAIEIMRDDWDENLRRWGR